jgi:hypothetical protein
MNIVLVHGAWAVAKRANATTISLKASLASLAS